MISPLQTASPSTGKGFSLLELLTVIGIISVLAVITLAVGPGLLRSNAMSSSLSQVASAVSLARSDAIRSRKQTYFALAPTTSPFDTRSFSAYAVLRKEDASGTNFAYVVPWQKLPTGVLFNLDAASSNQLPSTVLPYPTAKSPTNSLRVISFVSDGSLEEDMHPQKPILPLQVGTRLTATEAPSYQGNYQTNQILVERLSGKVKVERVGDR